MLGMGNWVWMKRGGGKGCSWAVVIQGFYVKFSTLSCFRLTYSSATGNIVVFH